MRVIEVKIPSVNKYDMPLALQNFDIVFECTPDETLFISKNKNKNFTLQVGNEWRKTVPKVIFNSPATILYVNGKKYVSKAHDEEFDEEKGLLMCLAKANGITHAELKRMIKGAKRQGGKQND